MMTHTFEHPRDPEVTVNLLTLFTMKVQHLQGDLYYNIPYFKGTKEVSIKIDFSYEGSEGRINGLMRAIDMLNSQVTRSNLCKIFTEKKLSLNEETNILQGKVEIHFFRMFRPKSLDPGLEDQVNVIKYNEHGNQEDDLEPLSAEEVMSEVKSIQKFFYNLLQ